MLSRILAVQLRPVLLCAPALSAVRTFASDPKKKEDVKKIPINPADYRLKKQKPCAPPPPKEKAKEKVKGEKKRISLYRADKKVEYEWVDPTPDETGINPDYDKVDAPNKANYVYKEFGYKLKGPEPTRYFDWERHGRVTDF